MAPPAALNGSANMYFDGGNKHTGTEITQTYAVDTLHVQWILCMCNVYLLLVFCFHCFDTVCLVTSRAAVIKVSLQQSPNKFFWGGFG